MLQILTDSASDITLAEAEALNIGIIPLTITFPDGECPQQTSGDFEVFYRRLIASEELPVTSQPSPELYLKAFREAKDRGDDVLVLALSGGLSGTVRAAQTAQAICSYDRVFVVDSHQAILAQRMLAEHAAALRDEGLETEEIIDRIKALRDKVTVSGVVDTLVYLRKGGRIPPSLAILGTALKIKPVIALQGTVLQTIGKAMGRKAGVRMLHERFEKYPPDPAFPILFGYTSNREIVEEFMAELVEKYSLQGFVTRLYPIGGIIGTHCGTDCIAVCYTASEDIT